MVDNTHPLGMYILYWLTNPIEFSSFMLLPLFFAQVIYPQQYKAHSALIRPFFIAIVSALVLCTLCVYILEKVCTLPRVSARA